MIPETSMIFTIFALFAPALLFMMFLPSVIELKKPQDAGPRLIMANISDIIPHLVNLYPLVNIEAGQQIYVKPTPSISGILSFLPKLDA